MSVLLLLAAAVSGVTQALPKAETTIVMLEAPEPALPPDPAVVREVEKLTAELPKSATEAKLLNGPEIAGAMDYPKEALEKDEQGTAAVWLVVAADGRPKRCLVERSSGSATLDAQTCDLFLAHARYRPAKDRRGRAVASMSDERLVWRLEDSPSIVPTMIRNTLVVAPDGAVRSCKAEIQIEGRWADGPAALCKMFMERTSAFVLAAREKSKLHDALVVFDQIGLSDPAQAMPMVGAGPGEVMIFLRSATLQHGPDGKLLSCTPGEAVGFPDYIPTLCGTDADGVSFSGKEAKPANLRLKTAVYLKGEPR